MNLCATFVEVLQSDAEPPESRLSLPAGGSASGRADPGGLLPPLPLWIVRRFAALILEGFIRSNGGA